MRKQQRRFPVTPRISAADHQDTTVRGRAGTGGSLGPGGPDEQQEQGSCLVFRPGAWIEVQDRFNQEQRHGSHIQGGLWLDVDSAVAPGPRSGLMKTRLIRY